MTYTSKTPTIDTIREIVESLTAENKWSTFMELQFNTETIQAELVADWKDTFEGELEFHMDIYGGEGKTEKEFLDIVFATIDAKADEATEHANSCRGIFMNLSPRAHANLDGWKQSWWEAIDYDISNAM